MFAIIVRRQWVESVGGFAQVILVHYGVDKGDGYALLTAKEAKLVPGTSFVETQLLRAPKTVTEKQIYVGVRIPAEYVVAIIESAEDESKNFGFVETS